MFGLVLKGSSGYNRVSKISGFRFRVSVTVRAWL